MSDHDLMGLLDELERALVVMPDESTVRSQIRRAASLARSNRVIRRQRRVQLVAAALAAVLIVGTGSVAAAGGLPSWMQSLLSDTGRVLPLPIRIPPPSIPDGAYTDEIRAIEEQRARADAAEGADADVPAGTVSPDVGSVPAPQAIREDDREGDFLAPVSWWCKDEERPNLEGESEPAWRCRHGDYEDADRRGEVDGDRSEWGDGYSWDRHGQSWDPDRWDRGDRGFEQDAGDDRQRDREEPDDFDHNGYESSWRDRH